MSINRQSFAHPVAQCRKSRDLSMDIRVPVCQTTTASVSKIPCQMRVGWL